MSILKQSMFTVKVLLSGTSDVRGLCRQGEFIFTLSVAYQHAYKWLKENPGGDVFIQSVHPTEPSLYRHQATFKYPWTLDYFIERGL